MRRSVPAISFAGQADVGLLLLTFFLLTTDIDKYSWGLDERLPYWSESVTGRIFPDERILNIALNNAGQIMVDERITTLEGLEHRLRDWYTHEAKISEYHISLSYLSDCTYGLYLPVKAAVLHAHRAARRELSLERYGRKFASLDREERSAVIGELPLRFAETTRVWSAKGETEPCEVVIY